jgi:hypothetical protein
VIGTVVGAAARHRGTSFTVLSGHGWFKVNDGRMFRWGA